LSVFLLFSGREADPAWFGQFVTVQCLLILQVNTARMTINRKRFLGEYERMVNSLAGRLDAKAVTCDQ